MFILPVRVYQYAISPLFPSTCRFHPTCSEYTVQALKEWGVLKGTVLAVKRISKCHPWGGSGIDPVPDKNDKNIHGQNPESRGSD